MIWNIDPILFSLGPIEIRYYGVFFALGLLLGYSLARNLAKDKNLSLEKLDELILYIIIGLILGARFGHIIFYDLSYYLENPVQILQIWRGGLSSHGGAIGAILALFIYTKKNKGFMFLPYADVVAIASSFMVICVRLGNFFNSEILGRPTDLPWGIQFVRIDDVVRHPSQLYEAFIGVLILCVMLPHWKKHFKDKADGFYLGLFLTLYFSLRFIAEFAKDLAIQENILNLTTGQLLSVPFIVIGLLTLNGKLFRA